MWLVFSVFDKRAGEFGQLYLARNEAVGIRMFTDAVMDPNHESILRLHPDDFALNVIGFFDEVSGTLSGSEVNTVISALDVLRRQKAPPNGDSAGQSE